MKKSINYWSFSGKNIYEAMDLAKEAGFEGIELALMDSGDLTPDSTDEQLAKIKAYADEIGIKLPSLASGLCWGASHRCISAACCQGAGRRHHSGDPRQRVC